MSLRIAFMGSPAFSVPILHALRAAGHAIAAVYCQPPRPAGRGHGVTPSPVHQAASALGLPVRTPAKLRHVLAEQADFAALDLDVAVVAAYGLLIPPAMLAAPRRGCLNVHASLLPRWRGASPIQAAILAGDEQTGVTIMQMDAGLDTGDMRLRAAVPITPATNASALHDALSALGARLVLQTLAEWPVAVPQPSEGVTYAPKLTRADGHLDWTGGALALDRRVRALNPWPGTYTSLSGSVLKIHAARPEAGSGAPGEVLDNALLVGCGAGALRLLRVQVPGRAALAAADFLRGRPVPPGTRLG